MLIGVIMGGTSSEKNISLLTGKEILQNLDKDKYDVLPVPINTSFELIDKIKHVDFAFIALHGKFGEDGKIQSVLESLDIPYSGSGVLSSALCMDKNMSKKILESEKIKTPKWIMVKNSSDLDYNRLEDIGYPLVIKPNCGGSSLGISIIKNKNEVKNAILQALKYDKEVIIEEYISGEEITCCMLNGKLLPILSITPKSDFFDYSSKYNHEGAEETIAKLPKSLIKKLEDLSLKCWNIFKCKSYSRIDIMLKDNDAYVLEMNTLPGMTENSLFPKSARLDGLDFTNLLDEIIQSSLEE